MLGNDRLLETERGVLLVVPPDVGMAASREVVLMGVTGRVRVVRRTPSDTIKDVDELDLIATGLACPAGVRLFELPEICSAIFTWDVSTELARLERWIGARKDERGVEFGCGYGRLLTPLLDRGFAVDGVDVAEPSIAWLRDRLDAVGHSAVLLVVGDISEIAFPGRYGFAFAGLNTLRYLRSVAQLRRHLHLAARSLTPGSPYVIHVDTWMEGAERVPNGDQTEWSVFADASHWQVVWRKIRHDYHTRLDLEHVEVRRDGHVVHDEYQTQLSLQLDDWLSIVVENGEWEIIDVEPETMEGRSYRDLGAEPYAGNMYIVLRRTSWTSRPMFTR